MRVSLAFKINIIFLIVVLSLGATLGVFFVVEQIRSIDSELDSRVKIVGEPLARSIEHSLDINDTETIDRSLQAAVLGEEIAYVMVKSLDGEIKAARWEEKTKGTVSEQLFPLHAGSKPVLVRNGELFGAVNHAAKGKQIGSLALGVDLSPLHAKRNALIFRTCILVLGGSLLAMLLGLFCVRILLRNSIAPLLAAIREIGAGNLSFRIDSNQHDEIGDISNAFDGMASELATTLVTKQELEATIEQRTSDLQKTLAERVQVESALRSLSEELEKRIKERTAELEMTNRELETFSYSVSHDLRAPLRHIDSYCRLIIEDQQEHLDEEGRQFLHRIINAARRMNELIDDLLTLSRVTRAGVTRQPFNISKLVREIADELRTSHPDRQVELIIADGHSVIGDPGLFRVVVENLLNNAFKYTGKKEHAVIEFGCQSDEHGKTFFVRDNGTGFDMEYYDKLFVVFQRLHSVSEFPGTGVGLATVQRIIHRHGGRIWAESQVGSGATFYFSLPE